MRLRTLHKWAGALVVIQVLLWIASGFLISLLDMDLAAGRNSRSEAPPSKPLLGEPLLAVSELPLTEYELLSLRLQWLDGRRVYRVQTSDQIKLLDAKSGEVFAVDQGVAKRIARSDYAGRGEVAGAYKVDKPPAIAKFSGSAWEVRFGDALNTRVYVDAADGRVLGHRNDRSAFQHLLLKLHFMDYSRGQNFNHPLVITFAAGTLWLALTGILLLVSSVRKMGLR